MKNIQKLKLTIKSTIKEALEVIDKAAVQFAIVVDENEKLLGTLTDGDIRRAILSEKVLSDKIEDVYFKTPTVANQSQSKEEIIQLCQNKQIHQIPVVDSNNRVIKVEFIDELLRPQYKPNKIILMVGGLGSRLRPLTYKTPKPMLPVAGKPILQTIVEKFVSYGFVNIVMCVGYKSNIIKDFFKDGCDFGANIKYVLEDKRMGTTGSLTLLEDKPKEPFFVMNGDLLTNANFEHILDFHLENKSMATMCLREYEFQVPYGVVNVNNGTILSIDEKPIQKYYVNAGIYILNRECIDEIPEDKFYDMPTLFEKLIGKNKKIMSFPLKEYWMDIGRMDEYEKANIEYSEVF